MKFQYPIKYILPSGLGIGSWSQTDISFKKSVQNKQDPVL
jgi:hypothetical protein